MQKKNVLKNIFVIFLFFRLKRFAVVFSDSAQTMSTMKNAQGSIKFIIQQPSSLPTIPLLWLSLLELLRRVG